jgi:hypothetical protein
MPPFRNILAPIAFILVAVQTVGFYRLGQAGAGTYFKNFRIFYRFGFCDTCWFGEASVIEV